MLWGADVKGLRAALDAGKGDTGKSILSLFKALEALVA